MIKLESLSVCVCLFVAYVIHRIDVGVRFDWSTSHPALLNRRKSMCFLSGIDGNSLDIFVCFQGQIMANLKAMDSDWFGQTYLGRKSKVREQQASCWLFF